MISVHVELETGFRKANINNLPKIHNEVILRFVTRNNEKIEENQNEDLRVDYVQVRKTADVYDVRAIIFPAILSENLEVNMPVSIKFSSKQDEIIEVSCDHCPNKVSCSHLLTFIFWLHRKSMDPEAIVVQDFWGSELESLIEEDNSEAVRIRDIYACDEIRLEADIEATSVNDADGQAFLDAILDDLEDMKLHDSTFFRHCRSVLDEFEPLFIHHTLLDAANNGVKSANLFTIHMEDQAKQGLFDRLAEVTKNSYKTKLWLETQYMRLRCSLIHRIATRKENLEDESIIESLFCKDRESSAEERQQLKQHKRFILKQTEKLENKTYTECGILLCESYPYICAAPDGITDDHIVEIKAPKTEEEFEKYLEGRETIAPKYMAQIQIQMYIANVTKALYCVLSPTFDSNGALHYVWVQADMEFVATLLAATEEFWKNVVFPRLSKIYLERH